MTKQEFIKKVYKLLEYMAKECRLANMLGSQSDNFITDMIDEMANMLITLVNPNLTGLAANCFYEDFWDMITTKSDEDEWSTYYDLLVTGVADPKYIERYGLGHSNEI